MMARQDNEQRVDSNWHLFYNTLGFSIILGKKKLQRSIDCYSLVIYLRALLSHTCEIKCLWLRGWKVMAILEVATSLYKNMFESSHNTTGGKKRIKFQKRTVLIFAFHFYHYSWYLLRTRQEVTTLFSSALNSVWIRGLQLNSASSWVNFHREVRNTEH